MEVQQKHLRPALSTLTDLLVCFLVIHLGMTDPCAALNDGLGHIEVNRLGDENCTRDESSWRRRAPGQTVPRQNGSYADVNSVFVRPLGDEPVHLKGEVTIIDPFKIFFRNPETAFRLEDLRRKLQNLQKEGHWEFSVLYKGESAYIISSESWDDVVAYEISRGGRSICVDELPSKFMAVVTKKLVDLLREENGEDMRRLGGISVEGVDGQLITSGDGDFVISGFEAAPVREISRWIEDECVKNADILCAAGGKWSFCDDSSDDSSDDEMDEEAKMFLGEDDMEF